MRIEHRVIAHVIELRPWDEKRRMSETKQKRNPNAKSRFANNESEHGVIVHGPKPSSSKSGRLRKTGRSALAAIPVRLCQSRPAAQVREQPCQKETHRRDQGQKVNRASITHFAKHDGLDRCRDNSGHCPSNLLKIIFPALVCSVLVTRTSSSWPIRFLPPSMTTIVPSSK